MRFLQRVIRSRRTEDGVVAVDVVVLAAGVALVVIAGLIFFEEPLRTLAGASPGEEGKPGTAAN